MSDAADIAADTIEYCTDQALRKTLGRGTPPARVSTDCAECGEPIEEQRLALKLVTCIACQRNIEARRLMKSHNIRIGE